jgi:hypothetical protein
MTPEDAPNASDEPLAVTKPPEDLAAQSTANASRTRRAQQRHSANPARILLWLFALQSLPLRPAREPASPSPAPFDPHSSRRRATV